eukprot:2462135-Lingulodinium_polyedra.AAC.1
MTRHLCSERLVMHLWRCTMRWNLWPSAVCCQGRPWHNACGTEEAAQAQAMACRMHSPQPFDGGMWPLICQPPVDLFGSPAMAPGSLRFVGARLGWANRAELG